MSLKMTGPFHGHYKPGSRIILLSNDGQKFAVDRFLLTKNSTFFRHLFQLPAPAQRKARHAKVADEGGASQVGAAELVAGSGQKNDVTKSSNDLISMTSPKEKVTSRSGLDLDDSENGQNNKITAPRADGAESITVTMWDTQQSEGDSEVEDEEGWKMFERNQGIKPPAAPRFNTNAAANHRTKKSLPTWAQTEPLELDVGWKALSEFLDMLKVAQYVPAIVSAEHLAIGLVQIQTVLPLAKQYDCPKLLAALTGRLDAIAVKDPWSVLVLASDLDDIVIGRAAIGRLNTEKHFHNGGHGRSSGYLWEQLSKLRPSWQLALCKVLFPTTCHVDPYVQHRVQRLGSLVEVDMLNAATAFNPSTYELPNGFTALPTRTGGETANLV